MTRGNVLVWNRSEETGTQMVLGKTCMILGTKVSAIEVLPESSEPSSKAGMFFGRHPIMEEFRASLPKIAACDLPILIQGETGTGKEVLARHLHALSPRANKPFIKLNCAAVPAELAESELFGYERGAFTGANQRKPGIFEMANGGTVMLDEIGDMEFGLQAKLLQVLQDQEFRRVGGTETVKVDVRVISATHRDLANGGGENPFRMDLFYRLNGFSFTVPSLRDRRDDIRELAEFLYHRHGGVDKMPATPAFEHALVTHHWPGNIRELETTIRKLIVLQDPDMLASELYSRCQFSVTAKLTGTYGHGLPQMQSHFVAPTPVVQPLRSNAPRELHSVGAPVSVLAHASRTKEQTESAAIRSALDATRWNRKQAAELLGLDYKALLYKMKKLGIA